MSGREDEGEEVEGVGGEVEEEGRAAVGEGGRKEGR